MFTGDLIRNANTLTFLSHYPLCVLHTRTRVSWFTSWEVMASSLRKNSGELGPEKVVVGKSQKDLVSLQLRSSQTECPKNPLWCSDEGQERHPNPQVRSRFNKRNF